MRASILFIWYFCDEIEQQYTIYEYVRSVNIQTG